MTYKTTPSFILSRHARSAQPNTSVVMTERGVGIMFTNLVSSAGARRRNIGLTEAAMTDALNPCPFCGGKNLAIRVTISRDYVECLDCNAMGPDPGLIAWNTRAPEVEG